jgi:hypothetical protein
MAKGAGKVNADPLMPARTRADWEAQGWATESEPLSAAPRLETTISIRFDPESAELLRRAARLKGQTKSQFVRHATVQAARKTIDETPLPAEMWIANPQKPLAMTQGSELLIQPKSIPTTTTRAVIHLVLMSGGRSDS